MVGGADESLIMLRRTVCLIGNGVHRGQGRDWARRRDAPSARAADAPGRPRRLLVHSIGARSLRHLLQSRPNMVNAVT